MESLFYTRNKKLQPKKIKTTCLICEQMFHTEDTNLYDNEYNVCFNCSEKDNTENIIKICKEKESKLYFNYNENIKSVYYIRCRCFRSHQILVEGLRNIGVQDYINIYCKCGTVKNINN